LSKEFDTYKTHAIRKRGATATAEWQHIFDWYTSTGRNEFIEAFRKETGLRIGGIAGQDAVVAAAIPKSFIDLDRKAQGDAFYRAHAQWFLEEMDDIIRRVPRTAIDPASEYSFADVLRFARRVLFDSVLLFEDWGRTRAHVPGVFGVGKNPASHVMEFFQGARQTIYGHGTWNLSFSDNHSDIATATIRQLLEIRLRRAFGVMWKNSVADGSIHPIALSDLLDAIDAHRDKVTLPIRFENIKRINSWSNMYLHTGYRMYAWCPPRILNYLRGFALGEPTPGWGHNMNAGVRLPKEVFDAIRTQVESIHSGKPKMRWWVPSDWIKKPAPRFKMCFLDQGECDAILV
jgi:hypothetical protein